MIKSHCVAQLLNRLSFSYLHTKDVKMRLIFFEFQYYVTVTAVMAEHPVFNRCLQLIIIYLEIGFLLDMWTILPGIYSATLERGGNLVFPVTMSLESNSFASATTS